MAKSVQVFFLSISCVLILSACRGILRTSDLSGPRCPCPRDVFPWKRCTRIVQPQKAWTVLAYLNADNDLGQFIANRLQEIEAAASCENINIIVQFDGNRRKDSKRFYLKRNNQTNITEHIICEQHIEYDMLDPKTLVEFISWGMKHFPSKRTVVIIAGHGMGILNIPRESIHKMKSLVGLYQIHGKYLSYDHLWYHMDLQHMVSELSPVLIKYNHGKKIDLIAFDSCQMGNFETLMTVSPVAKYTIASEYPITYKENALKQANAYGLPIEILIKNLSQYPNDDVSDTARLAIKRFDKVYKDFGFYHTRSGKTYFPKSSLALYDLSYSPTIKNSVKKMVEELVNLSNDRPELFEALFIQLFKSHLLCHPVGYLDLAHFAEMVYRISGIKSAQALQSLITYKNGFILDKTIRHTASDLTASGLSIFFPGSIIAGQDDVIRELHSTYTKFKITKETGLSNLINNYLKFVELNRTKILINIINNHINHGKRFLFEPSEGKYDELYLFTVMEISLYPFLENADYETVKHYLKMITESHYQSHYFEKHKKDVLRHLYRLWKKEMDFVRRAKLKDLIQLLADDKMSIDF